MNDTQPYFAIGIPALFALLSLGANIVLYVHLSSVMNSRFDSVDHRFDAIDRRFEGMEHRFELLTGKVIDIDNRLTRIEERLSASA